jgi:hypothetical protein
MHALAGKPIYSTPFEYEFGTHASALTRPEPARRVIDIAQLREQLGRFENPVHKLSEVGFGRLADFMRGDWFASMRERFPLSLESPDLDTIHRYLHRRLALIRRTPRPLREALARFQSIPIKEYIRLLDVNRLLARLPGTGSLKKDADDSPQT